jgi:tetratricopeptide (TPR) repeat protein
VLDPETSKMWLAECFSGLGSIYLQRAANRYENLTRAAEYFDKALEIYRELGSEERQMITLSNLASTFIDLGEFEETAYVKATEYADAALQGSDREGDPYNWAIFNRNLAAALVSPQRATAQDRARAMEALANSLAVFTPDAYLSEYRQSQSYRGHLHFDTREWTLCLEAYQAAIEAGERLLASAYTEAGRRAQVQQTELEYVRAAYALVQLNRLEDALVMVESGKTRLLAEALASSELGGINVAPALVESARAERDRVRSLEADMRRPGANTVDLGARLRAARRVLDEVPAVRGPAELQRDSRSGAERRRIDNIHRHGSGDDRPRHRGRGDCAEAGARRPDSRVHHSYAEWSSGRPKAGKLGLSDTSGFGDWSARSL